jgi:four helix bundle protein
MGRDPASRHVLRQVVRSASGGGSNYNEARSAESRADFVHKVSIAAKETRETHYWLQLMQEAELIEEPLDELIDEANQLVAILTQSVKTAKSRMPAGVNTRRRARVCDVYYTDATVAR